MYATLEGFAAYASGVTLARTATARDVAETEARMCAYIAPRLILDSETAAAQEFAHAVYAQMCHELDPALDGTAQMAVAGLAGFTVGKFSAQFGGGKAGMFPVGIAPAARAILHNAGLLQRGVSVC